MISTAKSEAVLRGLKERLDMRFKDQSLACVESKDSNGNPCLLLCDGAAATTEKAIFVRMLQEDMVSKDIFGNSTAAYTPHRLQFSTEAGSALTRADVACFMLEVSKIGVKVEAYEVVAGTAPAVGDLIAANLKGSFEFDILWPTKGM